MLKAIIEIDPVTEIQFSQMYIRPGSLLFSNVLPALASPPLESSDFPSFPLERVSRFDFSFIVSTKLLSQVDLEKISVFVNWISQFLHSICLVLRMGLKCVIFGLIAIFEIGSSPFVLRNVDENRDI